jgi:hypothetical protein
MHMDSALPEGAAAGGGRGRGAAGNPAAGPLVLPGTYAATIRVPGVARELRADIIVAADPMEATTAADRRARQDALVQLYGVQKTLAQLWTATRAKGQPSDAAAKRLATAQLEVDRLLGITANLMRSIESFSGPPTADQRAQIGWVQEDVTRARRSVP